MDREQFLQNPIAPQLLPRMRGRHRHRRAGATAGRRGPRRRHRRAESAGAAQAALRAQGEERHLHVHGGRPQPDRPVRSQARAAEVERQAAARRDDQGPAPGLHQAERRRAGQPAHVPAVRPKRHRVFRLTSRTSRPAPTTSAWCAPCTPTPSITIPASCCCSAAASRWGGRRWARGCSTGWAANRRICRASWC